jgi:hypothetical protein
LIKIENLSKIPENAIVEIVCDALEKTPSSPTVSFATWTSKNVARASIIKTQLTLAKNISRKVSDREMGGILQKCLNFDENLSLDAFRAQMSTSIEICTVASIDSHFVDLDLEDEFDNADLTQVERDKIQNLLNETRELTNSSAVLKNDHKRRILYRIGLVERELFKEKVGLQSFLAAIEEISSVGKKVGDDLGPIAKRVQEMRTITERKISGYDQIGMDEPPKQIEDKSGETDPSA